MRVRTLAGLSAAALGATTLLMAAPSAQGGEAAEPQVPPVGMTVKEFTAIVPQPYTPDPGARTGPFKCRLHIKDYFPTAGCGGFSLYFALHNVRDQPGYKEGLEEAVGVNFRATVDVSRTFGCRDEDGVFDEDTAFEVQQTGRQLSPVYYEANWSMILGFYRKNEDTDHFGPKFFTNFAPVEVECEDGMEPTQKDLSVTNAKVTIGNSEILGDREWYFDPLYADSSTK